LHKIIFVNIKLFENHLLQLYYEVIIYLDYERGYLPLKILPHVFFYIQIYFQRLVKVDGKVRTDVNFPAGFMDVISIEKTEENFRLIYDVKGRFAVHRITDAEARYKLCRVTKLGVAQKVIILSQFEP
jgi:hypothetical protein